MHASASLLPTHLAERLHVAPESAEVPSSGEYVLYWARTAVRAHENPALDTAIALGAALSVPVFVYHALSERYPYASDRHHTFILEGARDFAAELGGREIGTAFHLEREGHRGPHLITLAQRACIVVTELMPVAPLAAWTARLGTLISAPVWQVDTACVVPMTLTTKAYDRAFVYREATATLRASRVRSVWPELTVVGAPFVPDLPFTPIDLADADFAALVAVCKIDHAVGPVADTRGGERAGYVRWAAFVESGRIDRYERTRNDPTNGDGVSRMSAYLHYGMVSPFRLARDAAARSSEGAAKWLDELLIWRELAYTFCFHRPDHGSIDAIPDWARATLQQHEGDARTLYSWEQLARGQTSEPFWNAMQRSLLAHGELHNNVRMTWGKAFTGWTSNAASALSLSIDLNHRYALDGRDPGSYGGLLWCLGQFDRAFTPPNPVLGAVRGRPLHEQAGRIDVETYTRHVQRSAYRTPRRVAVIGAGLSGLMCARTLADHNIDVTVFEKSRGYGGRCATRRDGPWRFDHGAQYFTVRDRRLALLIDSLQQQNVIAEWTGVLASCDEGQWQQVRTDVQRWVGTPGMSAIGAHLAHELDVRLETPVSLLQREGRQWRLLVEGGNEAGVDLGVFDTVLTCVPAPQAAALLAEAAPSLAAQAAGALMHATMATMLVLAERPDVAFDGAFLNGDPVLSWISRNASKPGRLADETWVLHATREWSTAHLETDTRQIAELMTDAFQRVIGTSVEPAHRAAHRWKYALPDPVVPDAALFDAALGLGAAGDWCGGPRVEGALLSGVALAGRVMTHASGAPMLQAGGRITASRT